ncbi:hypothetical protein IFM89_004315 [Coptis chinensis]|uniref:Transposase n=1 Tax=Coptis chinensis TaxID=261450 RepID=A0A835I957_9MAGN|nr:hypothetical protein IFM89_004315 [Coptis chinensis]
MPICNWSQQWITELGVIARFRIPPFAHYWKDVTDDQWKSLHKLVLEKFDMDIHLPHVETTVNNYIRDRFRDHSCALHKYYMSIPNNVNKRQHTFDGVSQESWERWCDLWETDKFKDVSTHNQYSRSCLVVNRCAGSKSFLRIRADMPVDPETQQEVGMIALYRKTHFSEKKGWWKQKERMVELQNQPTLEGSNSLTEEEIFDEVLGLRARAEEAESQLEELRGWKEAAQETQETHQAQIQQQQRQLDYLMEKLGAPPSM